MEARSLEFDTALQDLAALLHRIALAQTVPQAISEEVLEREQIMALAQSFAPDDIQLFYQIALHGRNDLSLAPDEYAGFTMTLMRMLTFMPEDENNSGVIEKRSDVSPPPRDKEKVSPSPAISQKKTVVLHENASSNQSSLDWSSLIDQLNLKGMTKMLAQHSEVGIFSADKIELFVPEMHKHLLDNKYQDKIREAIAAYFGKPVELKFTIGTVSGQTPMALQQQKEQARQSAAVAAIKTDPVVKQLVEDFDAKIIDSSIKPIN
jgi:DNA polymerase-3 subunit gamma/tau